MSARTTQLRQVHESLTGSDYSISLAKINGSDECSGGPHGFPGGFAFVFGDRDSSVLCVDCLQYAAKVGDLVVR